MRVRISTTAGGFAWQTTFYTLPSGFQNTGSYTQVGVGSYRPGSTGAAPTADMPVRVGTFASPSALFVDRFDFEPTNYPTNIGTSGSLTFLVSWITSDSWPSSLPGTQLSAPATWS